MGKLDDLDREAIMPASTPREVEQAVLGTVPQPQDRFDDALKTYIEGPGKLVLANKSPNQLRLWKNIPKRAIRRFVEVVGDKALATITVKTPSVSTGSG